MPDKGGGELLAEQQSLLRSSFIAACPLCSVASLWQPMRKPPFPSGLPNSPEVTLKSLEPTLWTESGSNAVYLQYKKEYVHVWG